MSAGTGHAECSPRSRGGTGCWASSCPIPEALPDNCRSPHVSPWARGGRDLGSGSHVVTHPCVPWDKSPSLSESIFCYQTGVTPPCMAKRHSQCRVGHRVGASQVSEVRPRPPQPRALLADLEKSALGSLQLSAWCLPLARRASLHGQVHFHPDTGPS